METTGDSEVKNEQMATIRVMLVDDHPVLRKGIKDVLENTGRISVCAETSNANEAIMLISRDRPDVVIVDIMLDGNVNGIDLVKSIHERFPVVATLVLSMYDESFYAERAIRAGARGYIMKDIAPRNIVDAVLKVVSGELYLKEGLSKVLLDKVLHHSSDPKELSIGRLTDREFEIFQLLGNGFSVKEIAKKLNLSIYTIESHRRSIKKKLNMEDSSMLTRHAIQWIISHSK